MFKRIKEFFEKLAYAGLKPQGGTRPKPAQNALQIEAGKKRGAGVRVWLETHLTKAGPSDPLYLSNRTFAQKLKAWSIILVPAILVLAGVGLVLVGYFNVSAPIAPPPVGLSNAEIANRMLPDLNKDLHIESQHDLDVEDVHVVAGSPVRLVGIAKNNTDHAIANAELVFDLTDKTGSRQGAVTTELKNIASKSSVPFQFPIEQATASFALVREVRFQ